MVFFWSLLRKCLFYILTVTLNYVLSLSVKCPSITIHSPSDCFTSRNLVNNLSRRTLTFKRMFAIPLLCVHTNGKRQIVGSTAHQSWYMMLFFFKKSHVLHLQSFHYILLLPMSLSELFFAEMQTYVPEKETYKYEVDRARSISDNFCPVIGRIRLTVITLHLQGSKKNPAALHCWWPLPIGRTHARWLPVSAWRSVYCMTVR